MAYFTKQEVQLQLSPDIYDRLFGVGSNVGFGEIDEASGALRFDQLAEQASGYVDAFLEPAGYTVPIAVPSPFIKRCAIFRFIVDVLALANLPINEQLNETASRNESVLHDIATGSIPVPGLAQDVSTGTGGNSFSSSTGSLGSLLGRASLGGRFF